MPQKYVIKPLTATFINHATVLLQMANINIITDPIYAKRASPVSFLGPKRDHAPGVDFDHLPPIHIVLISHNHYDHMDLQTLIKLYKKSQPIFLVPMGNKKILEKKGIDPDNIKELDWGQHYQYNKNTKITFEPANHWSGRSLLDRNKTLWGSFVIEIARKRIFFAGDTAFGLGKIFYELRDKYRNFDLALLPIGAYKPTRLLHNNHVSPRQAVHIHQILKAKKSLAIILVPFVWL